MRRVFTKDATIGTVGDFVAKPALHVGTCCAEARTLFAQPGFKHVWLGLQRLIPCLPVNTIKDSRKPAEGANVELASLGFTNLKTNFGPTIAREFDGVIVHRGCFQRELLSLLGVSRALANAYIYRQLGQGVALAVELFENRQLVPLLLFSW